MGLYITIPNGNIMDMGILNQLLGLHVEKYIVSENEDFMGGLTNGNIMDHFWNPPIFCFIFGGFHKWEYPWWFRMHCPKITWMIQGYPHFWNLPIWSIHPPLLFYAIFDRTHDEPVDFGVPQFSDKQFPPPQKMGWLWCFCFFFLHVERNFQLYGIYVYIIIYHLQ